MMNNNSNKKKTFFIIAAIILICGFFATLIYIKENIDENVEVIKVDYNEFAKKFHLDCDERFYSCTDEEYNFRYSLNGFRLSYELEGNVVDSNIIEHLVDAYAQQTSYLKNNDKYNLISEYKNDIYNSVDSFANELAIYSNYCYTYKYYQIFDDEYLSVRLSYNNNFEDIDIDFSIDTKNSNDDSIDSSKYNEYMEKFQMECYNDYCYRRKNTDYYYYPKRYELNYSTNQFDIDVNIVDEILQEYIEQTSYLKNENLNYLSEFKDDIYNYINSSSSYLKEYSDDFNSNREFLVNENEILKVSIYSYSQSDLDITFSLIENNN